MKKYIVLYLLKEETEKEALKLGLSHTISELVYKSLSKQEQKFYYYKETLC